MPLPLPVFELASITRATTYHLHVNKPLGAFALCTVNDTTGELSVSCDWGRWSYQWSTTPANLGAPTLTAFLARCKDPDYVMRKLTSSEERSVFDPEKTVKNMLRTLAEHRLSWARRHRPYGWDCPSYTSDDIDAYALRISARDPYDTYYGEVCALTRGEARRIANALQELDDCTSADVFLERYFQIDGYTHVCDEPYNADVMAFETSRTVRLLVESILPAFFTALRDEPLIAPEVQVPA